MEMETKNLIRNPDLPTPDHIKGEQVNPDIYKQPQTLAEGEVTNEETVDQQPVVLKEPTASTEVRPEVPAEVAKAGVNEILELSEVLQESGLQGRDPSEVTDAVLEQGSQ